MGLVSVQLLKQLVALLVFHRPLGVGMRLFTMFHVPLVQLYFPNVAWLSIRSIVKLSCSPFRWLSKFFYLFLTPFSTPSGFGLGFGVRSFERFPFGPSFLTFVLTHPFHSSTRGGHAFHLPLACLTHDSFDVAT